MSKRKKALNAARPAVRRALSLVTTGNRRRDPDRALSLYVIVHICQSAVTRIGTGT